MNEQSVVNCLTAYNQARRTDAEKQASLDLVNAVFASSEPISRDVFEACFWALSFLKKATKPTKNDDGSMSGDKTEFTNRAREIVRLTDRMLKEISPPNNKLKENQIGAYLWALYAVAIGTSDENEATDSSKRYIKMFDVRKSRGWTPEQVDENAYERIKSIVSPNHKIVKRARAAADAGNIEQGIRHYHEALKTGAQLSQNDAIDYCWRMVKHIWANPLPSLEIVSVMAGDFLALSNGGSLVGYANAPEIQRRFFVGFAKRLKAAGKTENGNAAILPFDVARCYVEMCEEFGFAVLKQDDFNHRPVTNEQKVGMERRTGKRIRMKEWPSYVDEVVGVAAKCIKLYQSGEMALKPGVRMMDFLHSHIEANEWFGFYYARWLKACGRDAESAKYLVEVVRRKKNDDWVWQYFGDSFATEPEKARACYCRSLTCPTHDKEIADGVAKKTHRKLAAVLRALGQDKEAELEDGFAVSGEPLPGNREFYMLHSSEARRLMYFGETTLEFSGRFEKHQNKAFGFVRVAMEDNSAIALKRQISVFVPPPLAKPLSNGITVKGFAVQQMDEKKNRMSWTAEEIMEA